jgi:ATP adenylyltransferase
MTYIENQENEDGCIFCSLPKQKDDPGNLIIYRGKRAFVIVNRYPYTSGHLMVVPFAHKPDFEELNPKIRAEMMELATRCMRILRKVYNPQAFNLGANVGEVAGAGIPDHVHIHIVPRWAGDTNFMSTVGEVRVLPEILEETYRRIRTAWNEDRG